MRTLAPAQRRAFRAQAHSLHPVVAIGHHGLSPAVLHEIDVNLLAHELVKIRVFGDDRDEREALLERICGDLDAAPVQHIGKILTIWRPAPPPEPEAVARPPDRKRMDMSTHGRRGPAKKSTTTTTKGGGVKRAPRRGRSVIVDATAAANPRRRLVTGAKAQLRQSQAPHGKSASSRVGASGARRGRKA